MERALKNENSRASGRSTLTEFISVNFKGFLKLRRDLSDIGIP